VALVAQSLDHASDGSVLETGFVEGIAIDEPVMHDIPCLPEGIKLRRPSVCRYRCWVGQGFPRLHEPTRRPKGYPSAKSPKNEHRQH
jgi:hypothetical protein